MPAIGLDIHGVIDTNPSFFRDLTNSLRRPAYCVGWDIHVLTGSTLKDDRLGVKKWLDENYISYTHLFSISDYLRKSGAKELEGSTLENPWFSKEDWNRAKASYCKEHNIQLCLDDNDEYFPHFTTPVARYYSKNYERKT